MSSLHSCASKNQVNTAFEQPVYFSPCLIKPNFIILFQQMSLTLASLKTSPSVIQSLAQPLHVTRQDKTTDMEFVQNFTRPDFQAKNFTPSISPNFNSFSKKKQKK